MTEEGISLRDAPLEARLVVPRHVVYRSFPTETVVLNTETGRYHGLNPSAGTMFEALARTGSVREAAASAAAEYELAPEIAEADVCRLRDVLLERGLIEFDGEG